jgi:hypothetical protein
VPAVWAAAGRASAVARRQSARIFLPVLDLHWGLRGEVETSEDFEAYVIDTSLSLSAGLGQKGAGLVRRVKSIEFEHLLLSGSCHGGVN